jgi:hypothetical protein
MQIQEQVAGIRSRTDDLLRRQNRVTMMPYAGDAMKTLVVTLMLSVALMDMDATFSFR